MKWPSSLSFIRHGESAYNILKGQKLIDEEYQKFSTLFAEEYRTANTVEWASPELRGLAHTVWKKYGIAASDYDTPLTELGLQQAKTTGLHLQETLGVVPDIIYVSPYLRTRQTFEMIRESWPDLKDVKTVHDERIREQEHGLSTVFNDWRVYAALNPQQGLLMRLEGEYAYRFLNGENKPDVRDRAWSFIDTLTREHAEENVLLISHHLTLMCFRALLERWNREEFIETERTDKPINCGVTIYRGHPEQGKNGRLLLDIYNKKLY